MVPDPVLRDYLNQDLTYSDNRDIAFARQKYTEKNHPSSRELSYVLEGHSTNSHAKSAHLSIFFANFGSLSLDSME